MISAQRDAPRRGTVTVSNQSGDAYIGDVRSDITRDLLDSLAPIAKACEFTTLRLDRVTDDRKADVIFKYILRLEKEGDGKKAALEFNHMVLSLIGLQLLDGKVAAAEQTREHFGVEKDLVEVAASLASRHNMIAGRRGVMKTLAFANSKRVLRT